MRRMAILIMVLVAVSASTAPAAIRFASIHYNSPGADGGSNKSLKGEWFTITNTTGKKKSLKNWKVHDKAGHIYKFGNFTLRGHQTVKVHTGRGNNSGLQRYWGLDGYVWDNDADMATLKQPNGDVVDRCSYNAPSKSEKVCTSRSAGERRRSPPRPSDDEPAELPCRHDDDSRPYLAPLHGRVGQHRRGPARAARIASEHEHDRPCRSSSESTSDGGGFRSRSVPSFMFWAGDGHNHWHVSDFVSTELERADNGVNVGSGRQAGLLPDRQQRVQRVPSRRAQQQGVQGLRPWEDEPRWLSTWASRSAGATATDTRLPFQWIDITGLTPGRYKLTGTVDAQNYYRESNETNNTTWTILQLNGDNTVTVIQQGPHVERKQSRSDYAAWSRSRRPGRPNKEAPEPVELLLADVSALPSWQRAYLHGPWGHALCVLVAPEDDDVRRRRIGRVPVL